MIETDRLFIRPLKPKELEKYFMAQNHLANELGIKPSTVIMDKETMDVLMNALLPHVNDPAKNYLFYTMWIVIEKNQKAIIGGICFHGEPDENGEVEIGYGTDDAFKNMGYMTETITGILEWAKNQKEIKIMKAETNLDNISSQKVLEKNGFSMFGKTEETLIFKRIF